MDALLVVFQNEGRLSLSNKSALLEFVNILWILVGRDLAMESPLAPVSRFVASEEVQGKWSNVPLLVDIPCAVTLNTTTIRLLQSSLTVVLGEIASQPFDFNFIITLELLLSTYAFEEMMK